MPHPNSITWIAQRDFVAAIDTTVTGAQGVPIFPHPKTLKQAIATCSREASFTKTSKTLQESDALLF